MEVKFNKKIKKQDNKTINLILRYFFGVLLYSLIFATLGYSAYLLYEKYVNDPRYMIKKYEVAGNKTIKNDEILELLKEKTNDNIYVTFLDSYYEILSNHPNVKTVKIMKKFPDTLRIKITEYETAAVIQQETGAKYPISFDGKILSEKKLENSENLPKFIEIPKIIKYNTGKFVEYKNMLIALKYLEKISKSKKKDIINIETVDFSSNNIVFVTTENTTIHFANKFDDELIDKLFLILNELSVKNKYAKKIDMRFNNFPIEFN